MTRRSAGIGATLAIAVMLPTGCGTTVDGAASMAVRDDGADVAMMDTGTYATTPSPPFGTAGPDGAGPLLEAQRLAGSVVTPWEVESKLVDRGGLELTLFTSPLTIANVGTTKVLREPLPAIAVKHGLIAGFSTLRFTPEADSGAQALQNMVLEFPDPAAAAAAADELASAEPGPAAAVSRERISLDNKDALATRFAMSNGTAIVESFTAHGPFVLFQNAQGVLRPTIMTPQLLVESALTVQKKRLDRFVPTPPEELADLPLDPSGSLLARTLSAPDSEAPLIIGAWKPEPWLNFEDDPLVAATMFKEAGVDWVAQRTGTVYQTRNAQTADRMFAKVAAQLRELASATPTGAVPGLPVAQCFERTSGAEPDATAASLARVAWHFKCAAAVDRYVFTVYAPTEKDAFQRISAQYRILAGK